jgi:hypothetical protein
MYGIYSVRIKIVTISIDTDTQKMEGLARKHRVTTYEYLILFLKLF